MRTESPLGFAVDDDGFDRLDTLKELVADYKVLREEIAAKEEELSSLKEAFNRVSQEEIPELVHANGLSEIKLDTGEKVVVKEDISVTIESKEAFHDWLLKRDEDSIIKLNLAFDKMPVDKQKQLIYYLMEQDYTYASEYKVHWQTQKTYFRKLLGLGQSDYAEGISEGRYMTKESLPEWVKLFVYHKTTIK